MTDQNDDIAELYQENTKVLPYEIKMDVSRAPTPIENGFVLARFRLPAVQVSQSLSLEEAIYQRSTCRSYDPTLPLSQTILSRLIAFSCGYTSTFVEAPDLAFHHAVPSAGARYPVEIYPILLRVEGIPAGVYHYAMTDHSLELIRPGDFHEDLAYWTLNQAYVADTSVIFALTGFYERIRPRYGERGYRYVLMEAGHIAQNLYLLSTAYGLGALSIGGFIDSVFNRLLGLDEPSQSALCLVGVGVPKVEV